jgi:hypothetical protein
LPKKINKNKRTLIKKAKQMSLLAYISKEIGEMIALIHNTHKILNIFDQITFPMAISDFFFITATTEVVSSGNEVHKATIVSHITD